MLVHVGDEVQRGQAVAVVGSTGRSTGPHVHFEVVRDGRQIDPMAYVGR
jgi:murein DD-endopeptidase MepM/ murein hydrolase activator NlpD